MLWELTKVSIPAIVTMVFSLLMEVVNMFFVGHLNDATKIAGVGLSNMYVNVVC